MQMIQLQFGKSSFAGASSETLLLRSSQWYTYKKVWISHIEADLETTYLASCQSCGTLNRMEIGPKNSKPILLLLGKVLVIAF